MKGREVDVCFQRTKCVNDEKENASRRDMEKRKKWWKFKTKMHTPIHNVSDTLDGTSIRISSLIGSCEQMALQLFSSLL